MKEISEERIRMKRRFNQRNLEDLKVLHEIFISLMIKTTINLPAVRSLVLKPHILTGNISLPTQH